MQSQNRWGIYGGFSPHVSSIATLIEYQFPIYCDSQAFNGYTPHMVIEFKARVPLEFQRRTVQFCIHEIT